MAAHEKISPQQFSGWMPLDDLKPTERPVTEREKGPAGIAYRNDMKDNMAKRGFEDVGPIEVMHGKRFSNERKERTHVYQGHHRLWAAKQLGMTHVQVEGRGSSPPSLLKERP